MDIKIEQEETIIKEEYIPFLKQENTAAVSTIRMPPTTDDYCRFPAPKHIKKHFLVVSYECEHCDYKTILKKWFERHQLTCEISNKQEYRCASCSYFTYRKHLLKKHIRNHLKLFDCKFCDYKAPTTYRLKMHLVIHDRKRSFQCEKCDYKAINQYTLNLHLVDHTKDCYFKCHICEKWFKYIKNLNYHIKQHTNMKKYLYCAQCSYQTTIKSHLRTHIMKHREERPYACAHCPYQAKLIPTLRKHMKNIHSDVRSLY